MRRLFVLVLALLLPLQSAVAVSVLPFGMHAEADCETAHAGQMLAMSTVAASGAAAVTCDAAAGAGGHHGACGHHPCPFLGFALIATCGAGIALVAADYAVPATERVAYDSIVLGVPSPPPTFLA